MKFFKNASIQAKEFIENESDSNNFYFYKTNKIKAKQFIENDTTAIIKFSKSGNLESKVFIEEE